MGHILTINEALVAVKRDNDDDRELEQLLTEIDSVIEAGTGLAWHTLSPIPPLAKSLARLLLQIEVGLVTNPMYQAAVSSRMWGLQLEALRITEDSIQEVNNGDSGKRQGKD